MDTDLGRIVISGDREVCSVQFSDEQIPICTDPLFLKCKEQIEQYLTGERKSFDLPLYLEGTEFQKLIWKELMDIPYGETRSYGELNTGARAVGSACRRNPLLILVPCHRVIRADGTLSGYAGGSEIKRRLLQLEKDFCL